MTILYHIYDLGRCYGCVFWGLLPLETLDTTEVVDLTDDGGDQSSLILIL